MKHKRLNGLMTVFVALMLALRGVMPQVAYAEQRKVEVENHTSADDQTTLLTDIAIDGVDASAPGAELDGRATVTATEGASWEIPVLWVRDDLQMGRDVAEEGRTYLPVLAFFVPHEYALAEGAFAVTLSDSLTTLFGTQETISVYDASTGITYIMPASLKDIFARMASESSASALGEGQGDGQANEQCDGQANENCSEQGDEQRAEQANAQGDGQGQEGQEGQDEDASGFGGDRTVVEVYCAQTARDVLSDEDLQWLVELIVHYLEPQAVELLLDSFPAFREAADNGEIGKQIGLYVYYEKGDNDGLPEHMDANSALAYVSQGVKRVDGDLKYCYMLAVDVDDLIMRDADSKPIRDAETGTYTLVREGPAMVTFRNTIVHELFHALMDDYNRTGMLGVTRLQDRELDASGSVTSDELYERWVKLRYPYWFVEGTASAVENVYAFRYGYFQIFRRQPDADGHYGAGALDSTYTTQIILNNYLNAKYRDGSYVYFELEWSSGGTQPNGAAIDTIPSRYVTGYLATLYLSELAARYNGNYAPEASSVQTADDVTTVDSEKLRGGLDSILRWMHEGETLDRVISKISPKDESGHPLYADTKSFEDQFVRGKKSEDGQSFDADMESLNFVTSFLNYMLYLDTPLSDDEAPNGSILFDFGRRFDSPLDPNRESSSDYLKITDSNSMVPSTVKSDTANIGGGKSDPDRPVDKTPALQEAQAASDDSLPMAAKTDDNDKPAADKPAADKPAAKGDDATSEGPADTSVAEGATTDNATGEGPASAGEAEGATKDEAPAEGTVETDAADSEPAYTADEAGADANTAEDTGVADFPAPECSEPATSAEEQGM